MLPMPRASLLLMPALLAACTRTAEIEGVRVFPRPAAGHASGGLSFAQTPPVGGRHNPAWQNCRVYEEPIAREHGVHSLEHGAVWITYRDDLPAAQVRRISAAADGQPYVLVSPYPGLPAPVVASAWGVQLPLPRADDPRLGQFIRRYAQGRQTPEPGAPCSGALDRPTLP